MANATPSRLGQINGAGDALAIFLKVYGGEVLAAYDREAVLRKLTTYRTIPYGKSAQFPATGFIQPFVHTPGSEILGDKINANEVVIPVEGLNIAAAFVPSIDDLMNHYDYRRIYGNEIGQALAKLEDQNLSRVIRNAARTTVPNVLGVYPGDVLTSTANNAAYLTDGATLYSGFMDGNVVLDQRDIPRSGRQIVVTPTGYALLIKSEKPFDYRLNDGETGLGGYARGTLRLVDGTPVLKTNNLVLSNDLTNALMPTSRQHDYSTTAGLLFAKESAATVTVQDMAMEAQWDMRRQGWLTLGKYMCGHGVLRPEAAWELRGSAPAG